MPETPLHKRLPLLAALSLTILIMGGAPPPGFAHGVPDAATNAATGAPRDSALLDEAWRVISDNFYLRDLTTVGWDQARDQRRADYRQAPSPADRAAVINRMLATLGASHTRLYTPAEPAYYQLMDIFAHGLRRDLPRLFPNGRVVYPGIGIFTRELDGRVFVSGRLDGLPPPGQASWSVTRSCRPTAGPLPRSSPFAARWASRSRCRSGARPAVRSSR